MPASRLAWIMGICLGVSGAIMPRSGQAADEAQQRAALRDFNAAAALQNAGLLDRAATKWEALISQYPGESRLDSAYYYLGVCQLHCKHYTAAIATFQTLQAKYPAFPNGEGVQYSLGMARYQAALESNRREDFKSAAEGLAAAAAKYPQGKHTASALYYAGEAANSAGDAQAAITAYQKLIASFPADRLIADAYDALGTTQQESGRDSEAIETFRKFLAVPSLASHELAAEVRLRLALSLAKQKKYAEAEPYFAAAAAVTGFPQADLALLRQGQCRMHTGKSAEAAGLLAELPKRFPLSPYQSEARLAAGKCFFSAGKFNEAEQILEPLAGQSAQDSARSAEAAFWRARSLLKLFRPQDALTLVDKSLATSPPADTRPYLEMARADAVYDLPGRRQEARTAYEQFAAAHPEHVLARQALYAAASAAFDDKDYATARRHAEALLGDSQFNDQALLPAVLSIAAESQLAPGGDPGKSERYFRQVVERFSKTGFAAQASYKLGEIAARRRQYDEAIAHYEQCLNVAPQGDFAARARYGLAAAAFAKGDYDNASRAIERLQAGNPEPGLAARARYLRGLVGQRQKQWDAAAMDLEACLNGQPPADEAADARYALALCRIAQKRLDQAAAALATLVRDKPDYAHADQAYYELGRAALDEKRIDEAVAAFRTLAEKFPLSPLAAEAWFRVARAHEERMDHAAATAEKATALTAAAEAYALGLDKAKDAGLREKLDYKLADMRFRQLRFDEAATLLQSQLRDFPSGSLAGPARFLMAECHFARGKFDEALPLFAKVADEKIEKYQARALYRAGTCAMNLKKWPESQKYFETLVRDFSQFEQLPDGRYGLAVALQNQGKLAEARDLYLEVVKATEGETAAKARFMLGEIAFGQRKYEDAIEQYVMVTSGYPYEQWQGLAEFEMGRCFVSLGKRQKAIEAFQSVVGKHPRHAKAEDAARMLEELK